MVIFFDRRMRYAEGLELLTAASACFSPADEAHRETLAALSIDRAWLLFRLGRYAEAEALAQAALDGSRDKKLRMKALNTLGIVARQQGDYPNAAECLEGALALAQELGDTVRVAAYFSNLGDVYIHLSDWVRAKKAAQTALRLHEGDNDLYGVAVALIDLSIIYAFQEAYEYTIETCQEALGLARTHSFSDLIPLSLMWQAYSLCQLGDFAQAEADCREILKLVEAKSYIGYRSEAFALLGRIAMRQGDFVKAQHHIGKGFLQAWKRQSIPEILESMALGAELELSKNGYEPAFKLLSAVAAHPATRPLTRRDANKLILQIEAVSLKKLPEPTLAPFEEWVPRLLGFELETSAK